MSKRDIVITVVAVTIAVAAVAFMVYTTVHDGTPFPPEFK